MILQTTRPISALSSEEVIEQLEYIGDTRAEEYRIAEPFPHVVIDDFLPPELLRDVLNAFPKSRQSSWRTYDNDNERKMEFSVAEKLPLVIRDVLYFLNSPVILQFLERLTGIECLIPDPYFIGGGLHQIERSGKLEVHADFNRLERLRLDRRLNLLLYLNEGWKDEYGGHLELWDKHMIGCAKRILPVFNRCVIFNTTDYAFHGHPLPLMCPPNQTRKSLATYYYTNGRPEEEQSESHSTLFQRRPDAPANPQSRGRQVLKNLLRLMLPPVVVEAYRYLRGIGRS